MWKVGQAFILHSPCILLNVSTVKQNAALGSDIFHIEIWHKKKFIHLLKNYFQDLKKKEIELQVKETELNKWEQVCVGVGFKLVGSSNCIMRCLPDKIKYYVSLIIYVRYS